MVEQTLGVRKGLNRVVCLLLLVPPCRALPLSSSLDLPAPPAAPAPSQDAQTLDYDMAPLLALANNPRVTASLATVREALARAEVSAAPARPLGLLGLQGPPIPATQGGSFRNDYVLSPIRVELRQLLFDGGRIQAQIEQGKAMARQQALQAQADWQDLYFQVRRAYLAVLTRQAESGLAEQQISLARDQLRQAEARYQVGAAPRGDVLSATLPVSQAELTLQRRQAAYQRSLQELNQLLGLPLTTPLRLEEPKLPSQALPSLDSCLQQATRRPALLALQHQLEASERQIEAGELDNAAQLNLLLGVASVSQGTQVLSAPQYRGGFEMTWSFADGGRAAHLADAARAARDRNLALLKERQRSVELEVRDAYRELETSVKAHRSQRVRVTQAQDGLRIARAQYAAELGDIYAVRQAQTDLAEAQQAEMQAYFDYFLALARLDLACGRAGGTQIDTPWPEE